MAWSLVPDCLSSEQTHVVGKPADPGFPARDDIRVRVHQPGQNSRQSRGQSLIRIQLEHSVSDHSGCSQRSEKIGIPERGNHVDTLPGSIKLGEQPCPLFWQRTIDNYDLSQNGSERMDSPENPVHIVASVGEESEARLDGRSSRVHPNGLSVALSSAIWVAATTRSNSPHKSLRTPHRGRGLLGVSGNRASTRASKLSGRRTSGLPSRARGIAFRSTRPHYGACLGPVAPGAPLWTGGRSPLCSTTLNLGIESDAVVSGSRTVLASKRCRTHTATATGACRPLTVPAGRDRVDHSERT